MKEVNFDFRREQKEKVQESFSEKLGRVWKEKYPELTQADLDAQEKQKANVEERESAIEDSEVLEILKYYGVSIEGIREEGEFFRVPVRGHFQTERLPDGYAYHGSAARALLRRSLGLDVYAQPRDVDVVRLSDQEPYPGADVEIAQKFMPDDYKFGYGVEVVDDTERYFSSRDLTINEVIATEKEIRATRSALLDTVRGIIRPTEFIRSQSVQGGLGSKMLTKILRFYSEAIVRGDETVLKGVAEWEFEEYFIPPFWCALQLDKAYEISEDAAEEFVKKLKKHHQLPEDIKNANEAARYLTNLMTERPFYYRHAPQSEFEIERQLVEGRFEQLPKHEPIRKPKK